MADRASVFITIGGTLAAALADDFVAVVQAARLYTDWDSEPFDYSQFPDDGPLQLYAQEVAGGEVPDVEDFCCTNDLPFVRRSGGAAGAFPPEVVIWTGRGERQSFTADDEGNIVIGADEARDLGSFDAISQHFTDGMFEPPAFRIV